MPILITGCARSGTSLTAQICEGLGANLGTYNGLFENLPIREGLLKPMIVSVGGDRLGQDPLPPMDADPDWSLREAVGMHLKGNWAYKGVKMLLVWRNWVREFPEAKWVIVRRDVDDIAASCLRTDFMRKYSTHEDWVNWANEYIARLEELKDHTDYVEVWPHKAVSGDLSDYEAMADHCGLEWNAGTVAQIIDRGKWHS